MQDLYSQICSYDNLELAFRKARKGKTLKQCVIEFEKDLNNNLQQLRTELLLHAYRPKPLKTFILKDPKTRKISSSEFRDRIVHHALHNIIGPLFDKSFIYDSYANRKFKGTLKAIERFDCFKRKVSKNNTKSCFILKADIKHYFETVDHKILMKIIKRKISDEKTIKLICIILQNYNNSKGMPLGNLTSQFFANVYLNELDQFIKHNIKAKHYIRYVDDFVILHNKRVLLESYKKRINKFLQKSLSLDLHNQKSKIISLNKSINFLGFRIFYYYKLLTKKNLKRLQRKLCKTIKSYFNNMADYDDIYNFLEGWIAYCSYANTYDFKINLTNRLGNLFTNEFSSKDINKYSNLAPNF